MSYCRFSSGDVYLYYHVKGHWECCACRLTELVDYTMSEKFFEALDLDVPPIEERSGKEHTSVIFNSVSDVCDHFLAHRKAGHEFPVYALERIEREIEEFGSAWDGEGPCGCGCQDKNEPSFIADLPSESARP